MRATGAGRTKEARNCREPRRAFTLVEVVVALVLLAVGVLGALAFFSAGTSFLSVQNHKRTAAEIAYSHQEELRTASFDALPSQQEDDQEVQIDALAGLRDTVVEDVDEDQDGTVDYRKVTVTVSWLENQRDQRVEVVTLRSRWR